MYNQPFAKKQAGTSVLGIHSKFSGVIIADKKYPYMFT